MTPTAPDPTVGAQHFNDDQNKPYFIERLQAADVAHAQAQRVEITRAVVAVVVSCGSIVAAIAHGLANALAILGIAGSLLVWGLARVSAARTTLATKIQESFDTQLFGMPATAQFMPLPPDEDIHDLARRFHGKPKQDWYVDVSDLPRPYAILLCQRENLHWDWRLRRIWATWIQWAAAAWTVAGIAVAVAAGWSTWHLLLRWIAPSLPLLLLIADLANAHRSIARDKQQMALEVDLTIGMLPPVTPSDRLPAEVETDLMRDCRAYQDRLFRLRDNPARVPQRLYRKRKDTDEDAARVAADRMRLRLLGHDPTQH